MSIAALVRALKQLGSDLSDEQIAEALWMLQFLPSPTATPAAAVPPTSSKKGGGAEPIRAQPPQRSDNAQPPASGGPVSDQRQTPEQDVPDLGKTNDEARAELKQRGGPSASASGATGVSIYVPGEVALRDSRAYARALRALDRHERSRHRQVLDEQATIRRLLEERVFLPVQRPERERWLTLHLVLDYSRSMGIWHKLLAELRTLFVRLGVFKNIRIWALDAEKSAPKLRPLSQQGHAGVSDLRPSALVDPTGRTLVLVVSDAVSPAWHTGTMAEAFDQWGKVGPTALLQVLPQHLWPRSSLSQGWQVTLSGAARTPSTRLRLQARGRMARGRRLPPGTRVPIFALTPDSFRDWSQMLAGVPGASGTGYHLALPIGGEASTAAPPARPLTHDSDTEAIKAFLRVTSPTAIELAKLLAAAPILCLPIIRTVQSKLLPDSGQAHLAEIFLGGILRPLEVDDDPEESIYTFVAGAREQLLSSAAHHDTRRAFKVVSSFIEEQASRSSRFRAFLDMPAGMGDSLTDPVQTAFAQATAAVLRDLGYHDLARAMEEAQRRTQRQEAVSPQAAELAASNPASAASATELDEEKSRGVIQEPSITEVPVSEPPGQEDPGMATDDPSQIGILRAFRDATEEPALRAALDAAITALQDQARSMGSGSQLSGVKIGDIVDRSKVAVRGTVQGPVVGMNQDPIQVFFTTAGLPKPTHAQHALVASYLARVVETCDRLRLSGLVRRERRDASPALRLSHVYIALAAEPWEQVDEADSADAFADAVKAGDPALVLPEAARRVVIELQREADPRRSMKQEQRLRFRLERPLLLTEAISRHHQVVLLGGPGSGKSSFVRHLAVALARGEDEQQPTLPGWSAGRPLPIYAALGEFAAWTQQLGGTLDGPGLWRYLLMTAHAYGLTGLDDSLSRAFTQGGLLLLLDGLDQVADPSLRVGVARAVAMLAEAGGRVVVTCHVRSFDQAVAAPFAPWTPPVTLAAFALGQMRHFVAGWYARSADQGVIDADEAMRRVTELTNRLAHLQSLRDLGQTPLLLTMITLFHFYEGKLPEDRADLYEDLVELWLNRWRMRSNEPGAPPPLLAKLKADKSLGGLKDYHLRNTLERLTYDAHQNTLANDGRGLLHRHLVRGAFEDLFKQFDIGTGPAVEKAELVLEHLECESGLLLSEGGDLYGFPHLSYEEYLAGCHLSRQADFRKVAYAHWQHDPDRWREAIFLALGRMVRGEGRETPVDWLTFLLNTAHGKRVREAAERQQAAYFAAECLEQLGGKAALIGASTVALPELWLHLTTSLVGVVEGTALPVADRLRAGTWLGDMGDPRMPVTAAQWRAEWNSEWRNEHFGESPGYWCYVREGAYRIGGWQAEEPEATISLSAFWLARYPITVAQYAPFVAEGYGNDAERWWTNEGWQWKQTTNCTQPWGWNDAKYSGANQPVIGVTWYEANAYCAWLSSQVATQGYEIRLPTEAEWEAAAAYDAQMQRQPYPWGSEEPTPERAIYKESTLDRPAPVGCCPSGAAACGALDLAGNVWEWTGSSSNSYPAQNETLRKDFTIGNDDVPVRGGGYGSNETNIRIGARRHRISGGDFGKDLGLRVCLAPRQHTL